MKTVGVGQEDGTGLTRDRSNLVAENSAIERLFVMNRSRPFREEEFGSESLVAAATVVYAGPDAAQHLAPAREAVAAASSRAGVTLVNGLIVARFLGTDAQPLRSDLAQLWCSLRLAAGNLPARLPRTWYT